jgi:hypothetical protein
MTADEQIKMFVNQAAWLEAEYERAFRPRIVNWKRIAEILARNAQLTREFLNFMETQES